MSGLDEQDKAAPKCPNCSYSREFRIANDVFMFSKKAMKKRKLRYAMFSRDREPYIERNVSCINCRNIFDSSTLFYKEIREVYLRIKETGLYYKTQEEFSADDKYR
jgi:hypothetical protein